MTAAYAERMIKKVSVCHQGFPVRFLFSGFQEKPHPCKGFFEIVPRDRIGAPHMTGAGRPEDASRDDRHVLLAKERLCKLGIGHAGALHRGECVERTPREVTGKTEFV